MTGKKPLCPERLFRIKTHPIFAGFEKTRRGEHHHQVPTEAQDHAAAGQPQQPAAEDRASGEGLPRREHAADRRLQAHHAAVQGFAEKVTPFHGRRRRQVWTG